MTVEPSVPTRRSLLAQSLADETSRPPISGSARTTRFFCAMGVCLECEIEIEGRIVRTCLTEGTR